MGVPVIALRDYQIAAADAAEAAIRAGRDPLVVMATGTGKTTVIAELILRMNRDTLLATPAALVIAHRRELIEQARNRCAQHGLDESLVEVDSIQRLSRRPARRADLLVIDEAHHALADTYQDLIARMREVNPALRVAGFTATPDRGDGRALGEAFDCVAFRMDADQAVRAGWLARVRVVRADSVDGLMRRVGALQTIVFAESVEVSRVFAGELRARGATAAHVDGETDPKVRAEIMARFSRGEVQFLCNYALVTEGFDVPDVGAVAIMRKIGPRGVRAQMVGRGMRPADGKVECLVVELPGAVEMGLVPPADALAGGGGPPPRRLVRRAADLLGRFWRWFSG